MPILSATSLRRDAFAVVLSTSAAFAFSSGCGGALSVSQDLPDAETREPMGADSGTNNGCPETCPIEGFTLELVSATSPRSDWRPGTYDFYIEADGVAQVCSGALPLPPCERDPAVTCSPSFEDGGVARVVESGCGQPAASQSFSSIAFRGTPWDIYVRVERDGAFRGYLKLVGPVYADSRPYGSDCPTTCRTAKATMDVNAR